MKKVKVIGYIQAGQHRMRKVEEIIELEEDRCSNLVNAAIGAWLMKCDLKYSRLPGSKYEIKIVEEIE